MALTTSQIGNLLLKKFFGKGSTNDTRQFFEEPYEGRPTVYPSQLWLEVDQIPTTAPVLTNNQTSGVVQYKVDLVLTAVPGTTNSFQSDQLKDAIPFYFGDGSYNYSVKSNTNAAIPFGTNDWVIDADAGLLTFYTGVPANMPPKVSFYKYVGTKGTSLVDSSDLTSSLAPYLTIATAATTYETITNTNIISGRVTSIENDYATSGYVDLISDRVTSIEADYATSGYVTDSITALNVSQYIDSAELTSALAPYLTSADAGTTYETITNVSDGLALKLNLTGGTLSGAIDMGSNTITSLSNPVNPGDAVNLQTLNDLISTGVSDLRIPLTASGAISQGSPVFVVATADETISSASASSLGSSRLIGISEQSVLDTAIGLVTISGFATIPSLQIDGGSFVRGQPVFLSENSGKLTSTPPTTVGSRVYQVGLAVSTTKIVIDLKQGVTVS